MNMPTSKGNEWYTSARYIEAARRVMGGIDLDPASCALANQTVRATRYFSLEENGLDQAWQGRIWLNPPYGRMHAENASATYLMRRSGGGKSMVALFLAKLLQEYRRGALQQAVVLTNSDTDAAWFQPLWAYPICFADHRVLFARPGLPNAGHIFGTSFAYLGPNEGLFGEEFSAFGTIVRRVSAGWRPVSATPADLWQVSS